ncbi:hypothetical protein JOF29_000705 [Kribbella aluminosa]|uniref:Uncharacterized protein n=1 Tax=Kribbella aluminosa TaxID=416017 RepID=A0ABS4UDB1_9ACTN|nr:hypothetical protein [Kribbella aluminosa]
MVTLSVASWPAICPEPKLSFRSTMPESPSTAENPGHGGASRGSLGQIVHQARIRGRSGCSHSYSYQHARAQ